MPINILHNPEAELCVFVLLPTSKLYSLSILVREMPLSTIPSICTAAKTETTIKY